MSHLADGTCTYRGATLTEDIAYILEHDFEVYDDDQVAMRVTTVSVWSSEIGKTSMGDTIETPDRTWRVQQILEDDGHVRRLWVS